MVGSPSPTLASAGVVSLSTSLLTRVLSSVLLQSRVPSAFAVRSSRRRASPRRGLGDPAAPMGNSDSCHIYFDAYSECKSNKNSWSKCSSYLDMFNECQDRADAGNGPRSIKVAAAAPTDNSDPCHIHTKAYVACLNNSKVPLGKCMDYVDMYNECCWGIDGATGGKGDMIDSVPQAKGPVNEATVDPCDIHSKAYDDCQHKSEMLRGKYKYHLKMLHECRRRVHAAAGPGMEKDKSCDIHSKAYNDCLRNHNAMQEKCKHYRTILDECRSIDD